MPGCLRDGYKASKVVIKFPISSVILQAAITRQIMISCKIQDN